MEREGKVISILGNIVSTDKIRTTAGFDISHTIIIFSIRRSFPIHSREVFADH